jgi:tetratricopeptide (TPR) repeat protein
MLTMQRFILELRRRAVFRTAGLYVGICWIAIEASSVVLPAFEAPDWTMRAIIVAAVVGFPIMLVLAWVYEITDRGIVVQEEAADTVVIPFGGRRTDFVVIGLLSVALIFAVYLNFTSTSGPVEQPDPVSILIANFSNTTGDPIFDGTLEQTFGMGIEGASFVTAFNRGSAQKQVERLRPQGSLDAEGARLVAVREGIELVITGEISEDNGKYEFAVQVIEPVDGAAVASVRKSAKDKANVLTAVTEVTNEIREELGDKDVGDEMQRIVETFTAGTLQAAHDYTKAQAVAKDGDYEQAIGLYKSALESDPNFGRAYSGWAVAAHHLGRSAEAEEVWDKALSLMETMTERERYRTLGTYYMVISGNLQKAIESFQALVDKFPADGAGHNNLAVAHFMTLDFTNAMEEGERVLDIYPNNLFYKQNAALYAMYAGDFDAAERQAREVIETDDTRYYARLPVAIAALSRNDLDAAQSAYEDMAQTGDHGASHGNLGLADLEMYRGKFEAAITLLQDGIAADLEASNQRAASTKYMALAEAHILNGDAKEAAMNAIAAALEISTGLSQRVSAALNYITLGEVGLAREIAGGLSSGLQPQNRAYGAMISGMIYSAAGQHVEALDALGRATQLSDFWLVRFELGKAYLRAGSHAEALDEFSRAEQRRGEASAVFLDDLPTWRFVADLPYWRARAQQEIGMSHAARESYRVYLALRDDGPLARDARERMSSL